MVATFILTLTSSSGRENERKFTTEKAQGVLRNLASLLPHPQGHFTVYLSPASSALLQTERPAISRRQPDKYIHNLRLRSVYKSILQVRPTAPSPRLKSNETCQYRQF